MLVRGCQLGGSSEENVGVLHYCGEVLGIEVLLEGGQHPVDESVGIVAAVVSLGVVRVDHVEDGVCCFVCVHWFVSFLVGVSVLVR